MHDKSAEMKESLIGEQHRGYLFQFIRSKSLVNPFMELTAAACDHATNRNLILLNIGDANKVTPTCNTTLLFRQILTK